MVRSAGDCRTRREWRSTLPAALNGSVPAVGGGGGGTRWRDAAACSLRSSGRVIAGRSTAPPGALCAPDRRRMFADMVRVASSMPPPPRSPPSHGLVRMGRSALGLGEPRETGALTPTAAGQLGNAVVQRHQRLLAAARHLLAARRCIRWRLSRLSAVCKEAGRMWAGHRLLLLARELAVDAADMMRGRSSSRRRCARRSHQASTAEASCRLVSLRRSRSCWGGGEMGVERLEAVDHLARHVACRRRWGRRTAAGAERRGADLLGRGRAEMPAAGSRCRTVLVGDVGEAADQRMRSFWVSTTLISRVCWSVQSDGGARSRSLSTSAGRLLVKGARLVAESQGAC